MNAFFLHRGGENLEIRTKQFPILSDMDKLVFIAYDVFDDDNVVDKTEASKLQFLMDNGFQVPEWLHNPQK